MGKRESVQREPKFLIKLWLAGVRRAIKKLEEKLPPTEYDENGKVRYTNGRVQWGSPAIKTALVGLYLMEIFLNKFVRRRGNGVEMNLVKQKRQPCLDDIEG